MHARPYHRMCYLYGRYKGRKLIIIVLALGTYIYMVANTRMYYVYSLDSQWTRLTQSIRHVGQFVLVYIGDSAKSNRLMGDVA